MTDMRCEKSKYSWHILTRSMHVFSLTPQHIANSGFFTGVVEACGSGPVGSRQVARADPFGFKNLQTRPEPTRSISTPSYLTPPDP